jgi:protein gp37
MMNAPQHKFLILTKQAQNIENYQGESPFPDNLAVGVSVNRKKDMWRVDELRHSTAKLKVVSAEPLYEDLTGCLNLDGIGWLIIGAQTRPAVLPMVPWVLDLIKKAKDLGIPYYVKNNITWSLWTEECKQFPQSFSVN